MIVAIANDNADLRLQLEGVNKSNDEKVRLAQDKAKKARDEQVAEHSVYEGERKTFLDKIDSFQKLNGDLAAQLAGVKETLDKTNLDNKKKVELLLSQLKQQHEQLDKKDSLREKKNGVITFVDYTRKEVRTTLTTQQGARPPMRLAVFDRNAQGLPTETPKATIELISVDNRGSYAKIIDQPKKSEPLHINDQVYSIAIGNREFAARRQDGHESRRQGRPRRRQAADRDVRRQGRLRPPPRRQGARDRQDLRVGRLDHHRRPPADLHATAGGSRPDPGRQGFHGPADRHHPRGPRTGHPAHAPRQARLVPGLLPHHDPSGPRRDVG